MNVSAFGVEHDAIEKSIVSEALKVGEDAMHGMRSGFGGAKGPLPTSAGSLGRKAGGAAATAKTKLTPLVNTPKKAAAVAGGGGLLGGALLTRNNN